jgi:hypothetical protein
MDSRETQDEIGGRYTMDDADLISFTEAREQLPELRRHFFDRAAEPFVPFHSL